MSKRKRVYDTPQPRAAKKLPSSLLLKPPKTPTDITKSNIIGAVLDELRNSKIPKSRRGNVSADPRARGMALGWVHSFIGNKVLNAQYNVKFPKLYDLLRWMIDMYRPNFKYSTIQVNSGFACKRHTDKKNLGPSVTISLGDFTGGELVVEGDGGEATFDTRNKFLEFDGRNPHWVKQFSGERYSLVFFCHTFNLK